MQGASVGVGGSGVEESSGEGETSGVMVVVEDGSGSTTHGVGVEKETLTAAEGVIFCPEGGMKGVGVLVGVQATNRHKNTQYETQLTYFILRIRLWSIYGLFVPTAAIIAAAHIDRQDDLATQGFLADDGIDFKREIGVLAQEFFGVFAPLANADIAVGEERTTFGDDFQLGGQIEHVTFLGDAFIEHDVKFSSTERRSNFIFNHAHAGTVANDFFPHFDGLDAAHIKTHGSIELERLSTGGGFGVAKHHADFLTQLVGENNRGLGLVNRAGKFAQSL